MDNLFDFVNSKASQISEMVAPPLEEDPSLTGIHPGSHLRKTYEEVDHPTNGQGGEGRVDENEIDLKWKLEIEQLQVCFVFKYN